MKAIIIEFLLFFLLFRCFFCGDHIARDNEDRPPNIPPVKFESVLKDPDFKVHNVPSTNVDQDPLDLPKFQEEVPMNYGLNTFRDSSYISFTLLVGKRNIDCYFYKARKSFEIDFQVLKGGDYDIALYVMDVYNKQVAFHNPAGDGNVKVHVPPEQINTDYSICLDNQKASSHTKKVFIMVDVEGPNGLNHPDLQVGENGQMHQHLNKLDMMNSALSNVYKSLMKIEQHQERRRSVEAIDRSIMESNFEYVTMWALIQLGLMVLVSVAQLLMIRSLFDSRGGICSKIWVRLNTLSGGRL